VIGNTAPVIAASPGRVTYRQVLAVREFRALLLADGLSVVGDQVTRLAVALLVLERSGSPFAAAATYAVSYLTWLLGGPVLSALPDRYPRRRVMVTCDLARMVLVALLALPDLPLWALFAVLVVVGLLAPPFDSARSALLADLLQGEQYVVGNALGNAVNQAGQVAGFIAGGALVLALGARGALLADAATFAVSAAVLVLLVRARALPSVEGEGPTSLRAEAVAGVRLVAGSRRLRSLLAWGVLSACAVIAPEGLAVAITREQGGGALAAGLLTAAVPAGFLLGSAALLRVPVDRRERLFPVLMLVACVPLLLTPFLDNLAVIAALWVVAGTGNALQLIANAAYVQAVPAHLRGRAFGVAGSALMAIQGVSLLAAGALAEVTDPRVPVAVGALVALIAVPALRRARSSPSRTAQASTLTGRTDAAG
jgi:MFS family permease